MKNPHLKARLIKTARRSPCRFQIAALGLDREGNLVGTATNHIRYPRNGGGLHAEQVLLSKYPAGVIKEIWIVRLGQGGALRPIEPCEKCAKLARKLDVKIRVLQEI